MSALTALVAEELALPIDARVTELAEAIAARHPTASAVLFYGSCLRERVLDGLMLDFYLIVGDYRAAFGSRWLAAANRLLPPNVFPFEHNGLLAKYAVLSEADFARLASSRTRGVSVWARFAQPARLAWHADGEARARTVEAVATAAPALLAAARVALPARIEMLELWRQAFALTYSAELRAERKTRAESVVDAEPDRYRRFTMPALTAAAIDAGVEGESLILPALSPAAGAAGERAWARRRRQGKALTLLRLAKASMTYAGGIDYLAWKIGRHAGAPVTLRPWQRRFPLAGAVWLLPRLIARGAIR